MKKVWIIIGILLSVLVTLWCCHFIWRPQQPIDSEYAPPLEESDDITKLNEQIAHYQLEDYQTLIYANKGLFEKYVEVVKENEQITPFEMYVMHIFPIVASYQQYLEEDFFFENLARLNINIDPNLICSTANASGCYRDGSKQITIKRWKEDSGNSIDILTLYHELMHFLDYNINSYRQKGLAYIYVCNGKPYTSPQYHKLSSEEKIQCAFGGSFLAMMTEGGAETWTARYFNDGLTIAYPDYVLHYEILNALVGVDTVNEMFLVSNHMAKLYDVLVTNHAVTNETYYQLWKYLSMEHLTNEDRVYFIDTCIEIYEQIHQKKWYQDKVFSYAMLNYIKDFIPIHYLYDSPNQKAYKDYYYSNYVNINNTILKNIENGKYSLQSQSRLSISNDETKVILYVDYEENSERKYGYLTVNYDFDNHKIISYKFKPDSELTLTNP